MEQLKDQVLTQLFAGKKAHSSVHGVIACIQVCSVLRMPPQQLLLAHKTWKCCSDAAACISWQAGWQQPKCSVASSLPQCPKGVLDAGHETTGATLSRVLPELQKQPEVLEKLRAEQDRVISRHGQAITCKLSPLNL
jgi:hypothetical protein